MGMDKVPWTSKLIAKCLTETTGYQTSYPSSPIASHDTISKSNFMCPMHKFRTTYSSEGSLKFTLNLQSVMSCTENKVVNREAQNFIQYEIPQIMELLQSLFHETINCTV